LRGISGCNKRRKIKLRCPEAAPTIQQTGLPTRGLALERKKAG
jgi:hypothetical protein